MALIMDCCFCIFNTVQFHLQELGLHVGRTKVYIEEIGVVTFLKWIIYFVEVFISLKIFGEIYDKIRLKMSKVYCMAYGNARKCNAGTLISFTGSLVASYSLCLSVYCEYFPLFSFMNLDEIELYGFKIGLWVVLWYNLSHWFKNKFARKYSKAQIRPRDKIKKIEQMSKTIGPSVRKIERMFFLLFVWLIIEISIIFAEKSKKKSNTE
mmetsp:Transcript_37052/g.98552  ORF Transcript_37052/g.98552 Transcript_37052/m.98552 type:complete len:209 (+) Transcript_37052:20580-21206(+)